MMCFGHVSFITWLLPPFLLRYPPCMILARRVLEKGKTRRKGARHRTWITQPTLKFLGEPSLWLCIPSHTECSVLALNRMTLLVLQAGMCWECVRAGLDGNCMGPLKLSCNLSFRAMTIQDYISSPWIWIDWRCESRELRRQCAWRHEKTSSREELYE
jgi:hypothetical protein